MENGEFPGFFGFGTASAMELASAEHSLCHAIQTQKDPTMTAIRSFSNQIAAVFAALTLSLALISGTVSTPASSPVATSTVSEFVA